MIDFKDKEKINAIYEFKKKCNCGHSIVVPPVGKGDYIICSWCKKRVYRDPEKQKEHDKKVEKENFRLKMWRVL